MIGSAPFIPHIFGKKPVNQRYTTTTRLRPDAAPTKIKLLISLSITKSIEEGQDTMQNRGNWGRKEEHRNLTAAGNKQQQSRLIFGEMAAAATASMPPAAVFPQPPVGFFQLYGPGSGYVHNNYPSSNWGMLSYSASSYEQPQDMVYDFTPSPYRETSHHQPLQLAIAMTGIKSPHENDVLMGRGGRNNQFCGNERLRDMARNRCRDYQHATKKGKSQISRELVDAVRLANPAGRFLKKLDNGTWEDVGDETAREKTSQVLRDAINSVKTFSSMPATGFEKATTPEVPPRASALAPPKAVTHEKATPLKRPPPEEKPRYRPLSTPRNNLALTYQGWNDDQARSPNMPYVAYRGPSPHVSMANASGFNPNQYPITPATGWVDPPSAARKRPRYYSESPLVAGYHRAPGFYPTDSAVYGTPNIPPFYGSPPNPRKQSFSYTPPTLPQRTTGPPGVQGDQEAPTLKTTVQAAAGQPSGESTDCWINDVPPFQSHQKPPPPPRHQSPQHKKQQRSFGTATEFDPFNDDLLSDSEHRDGSPFLFP